jgi:hypothetical protein
VDAEVRERSTVDTEVMDRSTVDTLRKGAHVGFTAEPALGVASDRCAKAIVDG